MATAQYGVDFIEWAEESSSRPGKLHHVKLWLKDWRGFKKDSLSCSCESWIYQRKSLDQKSCKHTRHVADTVLKGSSVIYNVQGSQVNFAENIIEKKMVIQGVSRLEAVVRELSE